MRKSSPVRKLPPALILDQNRLVVLVFHPRPDCTPRNADAFADPAGERAFGRRQQQADLPLGSLALLATAETWRSVRDRRELAPEVFAPGRE